MIHKLVQLVGHVIILIAFFDFRNYYVKTIVFLVREKSIFFLEILENVGTKKGTRAPSLMHKI